jgi:peptidoglycan/xylan/chitin deacetylase (PgdA/CDA1 family)
MYHAIIRVADDPYEVCVSPQRFETQMLYLKRRRLQGVSVRELRRAAGTKRSKGLVGLTFDDAYENFLQSALPVLEKHGFSATVFVVGGMMGGENSWDEEGPRMKLLGADGVREVAERGMEIASHGMSHVDLTGLDELRLDREVDESRRLLSEVLGEEVEGFCYPYGRLNETAVRAVRRAGYSYACATKWRVENSDYDLRRPPIREQDGILMLETKRMFYSLYAEISTSLNSNKFKARKA